MSKAIEESKKLMQQLKNHVRDLEMSAFRNGVLWILVFAGVTMLVASLRALL